MRVYGILAVVRNGWLDVQGGGMTGTTPKPHHPPEVVSGGWMYAHVGQGTSLQGVMYQDRGNY